MSDPVRGSAFLLKVDTGGATFVIAEGLNKYNKQRTRNTQTFPVFHRNTPYPITDPKEEKYSVTGLYIPGDAGQSAMLAAEIAQSNIDIQVLPDGVAGFQQSVLVNSFTHDATPDGFQQVTYEFIAQADATAVGGGDLL
jgi:hypothetical protein